MAIRRNLKSGASASNKRELPGLFHQGRRHARRYRLIGTKEIECDRSICFGHVACSPGDIPGRFIFDNTCALIVGCD